MTPDGCRWIELPRLDDERGALTFIEGERHVPFRLARIYYLYDIPHGAERGQHAHRTLEQLMIALSGAFEVTVDNGRETKTHTLDAPDRGLYIGPMMWRSFRSIAPGSVCCVLASQPYDEADYIHDYGRFLEAAGVAR